MALKWDQNSEETLAKALAICSQLVGTTITADDVDISGFDAGILNSIYKVTFKNPSNSVPKCIIVRSPPQDVTYDFERAKQNHKFIGDAGIGPKVLLTTDEAIVLEYIESRVATKADDHSEPFRRALAYQMARFHSLQVPIERGTHEKTLNSILKEWPNEQLFESLQSGRLKEALVQSAGESSELSADKLKVEIDYVARAILQSTDYAIAFTHLDLNHTNILVELPELPDCYRLKFIDFDYSSYFYRGADLGMYFADCRQPDGSIDPAKSLTETEMRQFLEWYREESIRQLGDSFAVDSKNTPENMLKECKMFILYGHLVMIIFVLWFAEKVPEKAVDFTSFANLCFENYFKCKKLYQEENVVPK